MRRKETSADYRYFPEPDLVRIEIDERWKEEIRRSIPELPVRRRLRFREQLGLNDYDAAVLTEDRAIADYFEKCVGAAVAIHRDAAASPKALANWVINDVQRVMNERGECSPESVIDCGYLAELVALVELGTLNLSTAKELFAEVSETKEAPSKIVAAKGLAQISDESALVAAVERALAANAKSVADYKAGKKAAFNALFGSVMRETKGKANPQLVRQILERRLAAP
jgi:aspartyl-tRNA(Asn)/glutamyl-tRNA(Gln) amidotransferase subunit B